MESVLGIDLGGPMLRGAAMVSGDTADVSVKRESPAILSRTAEGGWEVGLRAQTATLNEGAATLSRWSQILDRQGSEDGPRDRLGRLLASIRASVEAASPTGARIDAMVLAAPSRWLVERFGDLQFAAQVAGLNLDRVIGRSDATAIGMSSVLTGDVLTMTLDADGIEAAVFDVKTGDLQAFARAREVHYSLDAVDDLLAMMALPKAKAAERAAFAGVLGVGRSRLLRGEEVLLPIEVSGVEGGAIHLREAQRQSVMDVLGAAVVSLAERVVADAGLAPSALRAVLLGDLLGEVDAFATRVEAKLGVRVVKADAYAAAEGAARFSYGLQHPASRWFVRDSLAPTGKLSSPSIPSVRSVPAPVTPSADPPPPRAAMPPPPSLPADASTWVTARPTTPPNLGGAEVVVPPPLRRPTQTSLPPVARPSQTSLPPVARPSQTSLPPVTVTSSSPSIPLPPSGVFERVPHNPVPSVPVPSTTTLSSLPPAQSLRSSSPSLPPIELATQGHFLGLADAASWMTLPTLRPPSHGGDPWVLALLLLRIEKARIPRATLTFQRGTKTLKLAVEHGRPMAAASDRNAVRDLFLWKDGAWSLTPEAAPVSPPVIQWSMFGFLVEGIQAVLRMSTQAELEGVLAAHLAEAPKVSDDRRWVIAKLGLSDRERRMLDHEMDGRRSLESLLNGGTSSRTSLLQLLVLLSTFDAVTYLPVERHARVDPLAALHGRRAKAERGNHFEVLEVHWSAPPKEIEEAWRDFETRFRPGSEAERLSPEDAHFLFERGTAAWATLRDDMKRVQYTRTHLPGVNFEMLAPLVQGRVMALSMQKGAAQEFEDARRLLRELSPTLAQETDRIVLRR